MTAHNRGHSRRAGRSGANQIHSNLGRTPKPPGRGRGGRGGRSRPSGTATHSPPGHH